MSEAQGAAGPAIQQLIVKVHSRCNLACDYCYVYEAPDQGWRRQPVTMDPATVGVIGARIAEHAAAHGLDRVWVTLHGGEPLLVGPDRLRGIVGDLRRTAGERCELAIGLQTNGVLLDEPWADWMVRERIRVGVSLDGGQAANDRHRRFRNGAGSHRQVVRAVELMAAPGRRPYFAGLLATIDPVNDPVALYHDLAGLDPGRIDLLLPHATWELPPPAAEPSRTVYGDWLVTFFDTWYDAKPVMSVRLFEEIMHALLGGASLSEAVGLSAPQSIVVETDGTFERTDALKIAYDGAAATGYNIFDHSLDDVLRHPAVASNMLGKAGLSATCLQCPIVAACGGGLFPHRYRAANGFDNPSVYCNDLGRLINHVAQRLGADLARHRAKMVGSPLPMPRPTTGGPSDATEHPAVAGGTFAPRKAVGGSR